jgi:general secretion pathway protein N
MTRRRSLLLYPALLILAALIVFMPLRVAVGGNGVIARKVEGIIWDGSIRDLSVGRLPVGDVNARLAFWPLFLGRAQIVLSRGDAPFSPGINGSITRRPGGFSVDNMKASFPVGQFFAPLPADTIELQDFSVRFNAGRCAQASGNIRLTLAGGIAGIDVVNGLLGKPRCDRGDLLVPLLSQSAMEHVDIRIKADGTYTATIFLEGDRIEQAAALGFAGFRQVSGGLRMVRKGRL